MEHKTVTAPTSIKLPTWGMLALLLMGVPVESLAEVPEGSGVEGDAEAELGAAGCAVATLDDLAGRLELLEREILLTQYASAVEGLRSLQRDMSCMTDPPDARVLGRIFLNLGIALNRMGLVSDGEEAFATAAGIEPDLPWNEMFAASMGLRYYAIASEVRGGATIALEPTVTPPGVRWFIDGRRQNGGGKAQAIFPGWHFVQVAQGDVWTGDWYNLQGEVQLDLTGLVERLGADDAQASAAEIGANVEGAEGGDVKKDQKNDVEIKENLLLSEEDNRHVERRRVLKMGLRGGGAVVAGIGLAALGTSFATENQADKVYGELDYTEWETAYLEPEWYLDQPPNPYVVNYEPWIKATKQLRYGGGALVGAGCLAVAGSFLFSEEGAVALKDGRELRMVLLPRGAQLSLVF